MMLNRIMLYCLCILFLSSCNDRRNEINTKVVVQNAKLLGQLRSFEKEGHLSANVESSERLMIGGEILLSLPDGHSIRSNKYDVVTIKLSNGSNLPLTFAELSYLAGDFIGDPNVQIGGHNLLLGGEAFIDNFETMESAPNKDYLPEIIKLVNQQTKANIDNISSGNSLDIPEDTNVKLNCVTGGGCKKFTWFFKPGLYLKLASNNHDHFGQDAIDSYLAGHLLALKTAAWAKRLSSPDILTQAYAYEAFAQHFLTDLAASGHLRTPRKEIANWCSYTPSIVSLYLANIMHKEDNTNGIYVTDMSGDSWFANGDAEIFINRNSMQLNKLVNKMQQSADQVYGVFNGSISVENAYNKSKLWMPNLDEIRNDKRNTPMLFKFENGELLKYNDKDKSYSKVFSCISTLLKYKISEL
ncbi:MAG: hypothetical protein PHC75_04440 [Burkholderiales bacterium]|nr:hypothetical protein [Burkholderiales bacterium]